LPNSKEVLPLLAVLTGGAAILYDHQGTVLGQQEQFPGGEELNINLLNGQKTRIIIINRLSSKKTEQLPLFFLWVISIWY